jgi:hypothetical protein
MKMTKASTTEIENLTAPSLTRRPPSRAVDDFNEGEARRQASRSTRRSAPQRHAADLQPAESERDEHQSIGTRETERWQESDRGNAASEWIDAIGNAFAGRARSSAWTRHYLTR